MFFFFGGGGGWEQGNRTLHFDKFSSFRSEKTEDARNCVKTHENEAVFFRKSLPG